jgi:hypothetical protein
VVFGGAMDSGRGKVAIRDGLGILGVRGVDRELDIGSDLEVARAGEGMVYSASTLCVGGMGMGKGLRRRSTGVGATAALCVGVWSSMTGVGGQGRARFARAGGALACGTGDNKGVEGASSASIITVGTGGGGTSGSRRVALTGGALCIPFVLSYSAMLSSMRSVKPPRPGLFLGEG